MDRIKKALRRLTPKERKRIAEILRRLRDNDTRSLDIKKLKGGNDIFRARKGDFRVIYRVVDGQILVLAIERRSEKTYRP